MNLPGISSYPCHLQHNVLFITSNFTKVNAYIMWNASWALFLRWCVTIQRKVGLILGCLGLSCYYPQGYDCLTGRNVLELFTVILASLRSAHDLAKMDPPLFPCSHVPLHFLSEFIVIASYLPWLWPHSAPNHPPHCPQNSMCKTLTWLCHFYVWNHSMATTSCRIK